MQCEKALDQNETILSTFKRALDLLRLPLSINPKPLEPTMLKMIDLVRNTDPDAVSRLVPAELDILTKS